MLYPSDKLQRRQKKHEGRYVKNTPLSYKWNLPPTYKWKPFSSYIHSLSSNYTQNLSLNYIQNVHLNFIKNCSVNYIFTFVLISYTFVHIYLPRSTRSSFNTELYGKRRITSNAKSFATTNSRTLEILNGTWMIWSNFIRIDSKVRKTTSAKWVMV